MKYCQKCGTELFDEAVICPHCGCYATNQNANQPYTPAYTQIRAFSDQAKNVYTIGVLAAVLCLGIGIIFSIIGAIMAKKISIPNISVSNSYEQSEFDTAKRKLRTALFLLTIPQYVLMLCLLLISFTGDLSLTVLTLIIISIPVIICTVLTKHLKSDPVQILKNS